MGLEAEAAYPHHNEMIDYGMRYPDLKPYVLERERIIKVQEVPEVLNVPSRYPSAIREIKRLTSANSLAEVGDRGPALAAISLEEHEHVEELQLFRALFGRDALRVASDLLEYHPKLAENTLTKLAEVQGTENNIASEEEPGRIIHEYRTPDDPIAQMLTEKHGWEWPYYGSVDATPSYVNLMGEYVRKFGSEILDKKIIGKDGKEKTLREASSAAVDWMLQRMKNNPEGLLEFQRSNPEGIENQVWKDSWDSYSHKDGTLANHEDGIASIEVQAQAYDALLTAAELIETDQGKKQALLDQAKQLRETVTREMWVDDSDGGYFVLGTDRDEMGGLRKLEIRTSNMGHLLNSRILDGEDAEVIRMREGIIRHLFAPDLLSTGGIRSLSSKEIRYRPGAYHNGNVWLWDNFVISQGLERHGLEHLAWELRARIWNDVQTFGRFPEFVRGEDGEKPKISSRVVDVWDEKNQRENRIEQPPQEIQAWSVAAMLSSKHKRGEQLLGREKINDTKPIENEILAKLKQRFMR